MKADTDILLQVMDELPLTLEGKAIWQCHIDIRYPNGNFTAVQVEDYYKRHAKIFYDGYSWEESLMKKNYTFSTGFRFHGNMKSFTTGIPTLWIMHDARTKELIEALKLPYIFHEEPEDIDNVEDLLPRCQYDSEFEKHYCRMRKEYVAFLEKNGLCEHNFRIKIDS